MKLYWPCGTRLTDDGMKEPVSTYDATTSMGEARKQIELWKDWYHFNITEAHIDVYEKGKKLQTIPIIK